ITQIQTSKIHPTGENQLTTPVKFDHVTKSISGLNIGNGSIPNAVLKNRYRYLLRGIGNGKVFKIYFQLQFLMTAQQRYPGRPLQYGRGKYFFIDYHEFSDKDHFVGILIVNGDQVISTDLRLYSITW